MQLKLFILPMKNLDAAEGEMNGFLRSHRVLAVKKEFVADGENSFWTFCVEYLDSTAGAATLPGKGPKVDYKEVPSPPRFETVGRLSAPERGAGDDVGIQDDNHRRWARTSRTTCSTAASSSAVGLGWERLRSSRVAHCSCVRGWCFRRTMESL